MRRFGKVDKAWGHEDIFISNDNYCGKYLHFNKPGDRTSMHFHKTKHETWKVIKGTFKVNYIETVDGVTTSTDLKEGDLWVNPVGFIHQLEALDANSTVLEISTADSDEDNFRVWR